MVNIVDEPSILRHLSKYVVLCLLKAIKAYNIVLIKLLLAQLADRLIFGWCSVINQTFIGFEVVSIFGQISFPLANIWEIPDRTKASGRNWQIFRDRSPETVTDQSNKYLEGVS